MNNDSQTESECDTDWQWHADQVSESVSLGEWLTWNPTQWVSDWLDLVIDDYLIIYWLIIQSFIHSFMIHWLSRLSLSRVTESEWIWVGEFLASVSESLTVTEWDEAIA